MRSETRLGARAALLAAFLAAAALPACSTVEGFGMDISSGARTVGGWFGR